jgi:hypothetical protein
MTNVEIRRKILEMTYELFKEHPYYRLTPKDFREKLDIGTKDLHFNIIYLEEKGYLELQKPLEGSIFVGARITTKGVDLIEDPFQFDMAFPANPDTSAMQINVFKEFDLLIDRINALDEIGKEQKEIITEEVREIQKEMKRIEPSYKNVKYFLDKILGRHHETGEQVMAVLKNPVIMQILSDSAKKELEKI